MKLKMFKFSAAAKNSKSIVFLLPFIFLTGLNSLIGQDYKVRALNEVCLGDEAEAYPFLTDDGLSLYFTRSTSEGDAIFVAERKSVNQKFSQPTAILGAGIDGIKTDMISACVTQDKKTIFFTKKIDEKEQEKLGLTTGVVLAYATRSSTSELFGAHKIVNLKGVTQNESEWKSAPTVSPNGNELIFMADEQVLHFQKVKEGVYNFRKPVKLNGVVKFIPRMSPDGLTLYGQYDNENEVAVCFYIKREKLGDPFKGDITEFETNKLTEVTSGACQISGSSNMKTFVYVVGDGATWTANNLYIATVKE
jgi:hypothetical protein